MTVDAWDEEFAAGADGTEAKGFEPRYANVGEWVTLWLSPLYRRKVTGPLGGDTVQWCAKWWEHPEAEDRLTSVWWAWEGARRDQAPNAVANWWLLVMDPMWRVLTGESGPFSRCTEGHKETLPELELVAPPAGYWDVPADDDTSPAGEGPQLAS